MRFGKAQQARQELANYIKTNPDLTWQEIAYNQNVSISQVNKVARLFRLSRKVQSKHSHVYVKLEEL
jgi:hypothetical protein